TGIQFAVSGYTVQGSSLTTRVGQVDLRVGDGTGAGSAMKATVSSSIVGEGSINKQDLGTLILTGTNTYTGGTMVSAGTLQIGNGGSTGSISGDVVNNAKLAINRGNDFTFSGAISGTGSLEKLGS